MRPENANPVRFSRKRILYTDEEFSIAYGEWINNSGEIEMVMGMRWNGELNDENDIGFPRQGNHPTWFMVSNPVRDLLLSSLLLSRDSNMDLLAEVISELRNEIGR